MLKIRKIDLNRISINAIFFFGLSVAVWILCGLNTKTVDREMYVMFYKYAGNGTNYPGVEIGYCLFQRVCCLLNMSYQSFLCIYSLIAVWLIANSIYTYVNHNAVLILMIFMYFPFLHIFVAQRNFMACAIMLYAVRYLLRESTLKNNLKYTILILLSCLFHTASILYLFFLFIRVDYKVIRRIVIFLASAMIVYLVFGSSIEQILILLIPKLGNYLIVERGTRLATKIFLLAYFCAKLFFGELALQYLDDKHKKLMKMSLLISFMVPMGAINMNFLRFEYNTLVLFLIAILGSKKKQLQLLPNYRLVKNCCVALYLVSGFILLYLFSFESIVMMVLKNNLLY